MQKRKRIKRRRTSTYLFILYCFKMARVCMISGKKTVSGNNRSHSMRATKRKYKVNLIKKKMIIDGFPITVKIAANYYKKYKNMFVN
jgi:large subunit ribosomal protein L28